MIVHVDTWNQIPPGPSKPSDCSCSSPTETSFFSKSIPSAAPATNIPNLGNQIQKHQKPIKTCWLRMERCGSPIVVP